MRVTVTTETMTRWGLMAMLFSGALVRAQDGGTVEASLTKPVEPPAMMMQGPDPSAPPPAPAPAPAAATASAYPVEDEAKALAWMDERLATGRYVELFKAVSPSAEREERAELQWRLARILISYYEVEKTAPDEEKLNAYKLGETLTRKCLAKDPAKVPHCYLYLGISVGRQGTLKGVLKSLRLAKEVEASWLKGLELSKGKPYKLDEDLLEAHFYYVLGIFYRLVPDWWIVKLIAGTRGDKAKSIEMHRNSARLRPKIPAYLELGVSLLCRGQKEDDNAQIEEGKAVVKQVTAMKAMDDLDRVDLKNANALLANTKPACGYSRDKMQEVEDQSKVK